MILKFDEQLLDELTEQAKKSERLRMNLDLRTSSSDKSQRMLNALEPGTVIPIHRHTTSTEVLVMIRGKIKENLYDNNGVLIESIIVESNGRISGISLPVGQWHNTECLVSGTVFMECKDGPYAPLNKNDIIEKF